MTLFASPSARLLIRAVLAGIATFAVKLQDAPLTRAAVVGAITAAVWAAVEYLTPVNQLVGARLVPPAAGGSGGGS